MSGRADTYLRPGDAARAGWAPVLRVDLRVVLRLGAALRVVLCLAAVLVVVAGASSTDLASFAAFFTALASAFAAFFFAFFAMWLASLCPLEGEVPPAIPYDTGGMARLQTPARKRDKPSVPERRDHRITDDRLSRGDLRSAFMLLNLPQFDRFPFAAATHPPVTSTGQLTSAATVGAATCDQHASEVLSRLGHDRSQLTLARVLAPK